MWHLSDDVMTELDFARLQMAVSLAFHIVFAAVGIGMPLLMVLAEIRWRRTGDAEYLALAKRWAKGTAVFFAVGAVSGTVLSFELGLLFPGFMDKAGALVGMPFSLEGTAFFTEAIFLGIYLYGWDKVRPSLHIAAGLVVAASGAASALFVTIVNAWMNQPTGFDLDAAGNIVNVDPIAAMASPYVFHEVTHTLLAAYMTTAFAVAGIHAWALRRRPDSGFHKKALGLALAMAIPSALAQPIIGHHAGQVVAKGQPMKLAAMEQQLETRRGAPITLGPVELPGLLSFMAFNDFDAEVKGLEEVPPADRPPAIVRPAFQIMVGLGTAAAGYAALTVFLWWRRRRLPEARWWRAATILLAPSGLIAMEAGWTVTEVGRQPWVIHDVLRTADAVTPMTGLVAPFVTFTAVYLGLSVVVAAVLWRQVRQTT